MLRPATPLTLIFLVAFVLLLLSTLSTPIITSIPLGTYQGYNFGVFGYCKGSTGCSGYKIGYTTDGLFSSNSADNFSLPASTRHSLSSILIVHPIAAFLTLICLGLSIAAHFHSPSHSPRYLLALLILTIPTLLITLLAFLVDILLFVPHMQWGGWIVLGATILIIASSVVTCAMRRTLVSRKARKKRIAENAEMNGTNYYNNLAQNRLMSDSAQLPRAESPPPMSGSTAVDKGMPQFAAFEMKRQDMNPQSRDGDTGMGSLDDRTPLNPTPSVRSGSSGGGRRAYMDGGDAPPMPMAGRPSLDSQGRPRRPSRDQYGNPIPMGMAGELPPPGLRHHGSQGSIGSNGSYGSRGRGRGGYGPPPRGYPGSRGGYGPPRGAYGARGGFRGGPPPPGWNGRGRGGYGPPPTGMRGPPPPRQGPPPGYANDQYYGGPPGPNSGPSPTIDRSPDAFIAGPDVPIGTAIEMDERTGSPPVAGSPSGPEYFNQNYGLRDSDADVDGMVGLQQDRRPSPLRHDSERSSGVRSPTSIYSDQTYVPPRQHWAQPQPLDRHQSPLAMGSNSSHPISNIPSSNVLPLSPIQASPRSPQSAGGHHRQISENYYEDVDPRFAVEEPSDTGFSHDSGIPTALTPGPGMPMPGGYPATPGAQQQQQHSYRMQSSPHPPLNPAYLHPKYVGGSGPTNDGRSVSSLNNYNNNNNHSHSQTGGSSSGSLQRDNSSENLPDGARSPGEGSERTSEASHFTSISQRPVNPNWRPGGMGPAGGGSSASAMRSKKEDVILTANPDFALPGMGAGRGRGGMAGRGGRGGFSPTGAGGLTPMGRYPTDV